MRRGEGFSVTEGGGLGAWVRQKPFSILVIAGGLLYIGLALLVLSVPLIVIGALMVPGGEFILVIFLFIVLFLIAAVFTLREARWAYVLGSAVSVLFALLYSSVIASTVSNPADDYFWLVMSLLPVTFLILLFTTLTLRAGKAGVREKGYLATSRSTGGLLTLAVIGFVAGSLIVGGIGRQAILRNIGAPSADIEIVPGAVGVAMAYSPQTYNVAAGSTVTWLNRDTMSHTVTSNETGVFDSGLLTTGQTWSHVFMTPGTYYYRCTPHNQMWGVIIVT